MRSRTRVAGALLGVALLAALTPPGVSGAAEQPGAGRARAKPITAVDPVRVVTLITGDQVTVRLDGDEVAEVVRLTRGKGRAGITFTTARVDKRLLVVPNDAWPLLGAGRLDRRLFDVATLVEFRYDDDRRTDLPLIVTGGQEGTRSRAKGMTGVSAVRAVPGGTALRAAKADIGAVWQGLRGDLSTPSAAQPTVWLDGLRERLLDQSVPQVGAPAAWTAGYTGAGVKVAVVDSGVDSTHPDFAGRVVAEQDFVEDGHTRDLVGHGTHVAATIGSSGDRYKGVAPGVQLVSAKVCMEFGCPESAILAGMQWSVEQGAKVVNMSLGRGDTPEQDPLEAAVEELTARHGALFVVAAGNAGADRTIGSPGSADAALTVGAVTKADDLAILSSRGPRTGDSALKPDITAPGIDIVAARSKDATDGGPGDTHMALSGTSMATPHVAGAAAILAQQHPTWTPAQLKAALMGSAAPRTGLSAYAQGAGRLDVARAIGQSVFADPPSVSFGLQTWPHQDDGPVTRAVTYRNQGAADARLDLSLASGAPAGMFTLSADTVTVPAGGTASVTVTANTRMASADATFGGHLVARAGDRVVTTPFAVDKEVESYDVTVRHLDRAGQPAADAFSLLLNPQTVDFVDVVGAGRSLRVPKGRYVVNTLIFDPESGVSTHLVEPDLNVDRARTLTRDAGSARPISVTVPQSDAAPLGASTNTAVALDGGGVAPFIVEAESFDKLYAGPAGQRTTNPRLTSVVTGAWTKAGVDPIDSPYLTQASWRSKGRMFAGLRKRVTMADLATVEATHAAQGSATGFLFSAAAWPDGPVVFFGFSTSVRLPGSRVEYRNTHDGAGWRRLFVEHGTDATGTGNVLDSPLTVYQPGRRYREGRNRGVYGPGFTHPPYFEQFWVTRRGDDMTLVPPLANDQLNWTGLPDNASYRTTFDRNGERVFDEPFLGIQTRVPPGDAEYRLGVELTRAAPNTLSTKVSCVWTFRSDTVAGDRWVPLPLSAVRFLPPLNRENTAPADKPWALPFEVQRQPGSSAGAVRTLTIEVSYDDGATWHPARVARTGQRGVAFLHHPAGAGFVSLRANATDRAGNTVSQTVVRAYRLA